MTEIRNILVLGVTGSIAAYKAAELTSQLRKAGVEVRVMMTESATHLVCPQTFQTLSWQPRHIELALETKLLVIAPATANILAKMAHGIADDALSTFYLSHDGPVLVAPAMNPRMWKHPATQANVKMRQKRGVKFVGPVVGSVACGEAGMGRMAPVEDILAAALEEFKG